MNEPSWLVRVVECFSNKTDELVSEFALPRVEFPELQRLWNAHPDDPLFGCTPIEKEQAPFFRDVIGIDFDFFQYSYFMSAYTTDYDAMKRDGGFMGQFAPPLELPAFPNLKRVMPKTPN